MNPNSDREAISLIIGGLIAAGCMPTLSRDGGGDDLPYGDKESALDWLTSCDESVLFLDLPEGGEPSHVYFVLGNDPAEVACDHGVSLSPYLDPIVSAWAVA